MMEMNEIEPRLRAVEHENATLKGDINLLRQEIRHLSGSMDKLNDTISRIGWIIGGSFMTAIVAWIVGGGLAN